MTEDQASALVYRIERSLLTRPDQKQEDVFIWDRQKDPSNKVFCTECNEIFGDESANHLAAVNHWSTNHPNEWALMVMGS